MTVIPLGAGLPRRSSHLPADLSEPLTARQARACSIRLFGVAPGGGYRVSPLGAPDARTSPRAGPKDSSLWPYSSSSPKASLRLVRTAVSRHPALWSPDFPLRTLRRAATVWPASQANFSTCRGAALPFRRRAARRLLFSAFAPRFRFAAAGRRVLRLLGLPAPGTKVLGIVVIALVFVVCGPAGDAQHRQRCIGFGRGERFRIAEIFRQARVERGKLLRQGLVEAIETLRPEGTRPRDALSREWENYVVLHDAYVEGVQNREVMMRLYISEGTFNRSRRKALRGVARYLLERHQVSKK